MPEKVFIRNIPDDLWRALKARANLDGLTVSEAVQEAIQGFLAGHGSARGTADPWGSIIGLGASGVADVAERHDHYLAEAVDAGQRSRKQ